MITITRNNSEQEAPKLQGTASAYEIEQESTTLEAFRAQLKEDFKAIGDIDWIKK